MSIDRQADEVIELPQLIIFDVNETLSDMAPMRDLWRAAGVPGHIAGQWFAEVLRDGFALTASLQHHPFADIARDAAERLLGEPVRRMLARRQTASWRVLPPLVSIPTWRPVSVRSGPLPSDS